MLNVIIFNLKFLLNTILERSPGLLKVYWHQNFMLTSQCTVVGQLLIHVQKGSARRGRLTGQSTNSLV